MRPAIARLLFVASVACLLGGVACSRAIQTGELYIAFEYFPNAPKPKLDWTRDPLELPVVPGGLIDLSPGFGDVREGDHVYFLAPPDRVQALDRFFAERPPQATPEAGLVEDFFVPGETTLGARAPGAPVNLEVDVIAKYVERLLGGVAR